MAIAIISGTLWIEAIMNIRLDKNLKRNCQYLFDIFDIVKNNWRFYIETKSIIRYLTTSITKPD